MKKVISIIIVLVIILTGGVLAAKSVLYPIDYKEDIKKYSKEYDVNQYALASLIKFETNFDNRDYEKGKSNGILNMRDEFAIDLAKKAGIEEFNPSDLAKPEVAIKLGAVFMSQFDKNDISEIVQQWSIRYEKDENKDRMKDYAKQYYLPKIEKSIKIYKALNPGL